jgi:hypothetical protein
LHSSIAENLMFGVPLRKSFDIKRLLDNKLFMNFIANAGLEKPLLKLGGDLAGQALNILGDLPPSAVFGNEMLIEQEELEDCRRILTGAGKEGLDAFRRRTAACCCSWPCGILRDGTTW